METATKEPASEASPSANRRKLRVLVISMGGSRQEHIQRLFSQPQMQEYFDSPAFTPGVSARALRNRFDFLRIANQAGLLPPSEWKAIYEEHQRQQLQPRHSELFFDCLKNIPITKGRRGSDQDKSRHYSAELWFKAKTINRGRSVLACSLAHLIAMKRCVDDGYDIVLEDNVRAPLETCGERVWGVIQASNEFSNRRGDKNAIDACHFRMFGWLGSVTNLQWIFQVHIPKRVYKRNKDAAEGPSETASIFPFPCPEHLEADKDEVDTIEQFNKQASVEMQSTDHGGKSRDSKTHDRPGGNPVWGAYAYWISKEAHSRLMETLRTDVGAIVWKGRRMRFYAVKPIDKVLPRRIMSLFGKQSVQLATHPCFFRAPMLTSKIHTQWDPEFCKSTGYQLSQDGVDWDDMWLTETERNIVRHFKEKGEWLTTAQLECVHDEL